MSASMISKISACVRRFCRAESGVTAIEFAFVGPIVILMSGIMLETGAVLFSEYSLQSGVQRAARDVKVGIAQEKALKLADFKKRICTLAKAGIKCDDINVYLKPYATFETMYTDMPDILNVGSPKGVGGTEKELNYGCGAASEAVVLVATYDWKFSLAYFMRPFGNLDNGDTRRLVGMAVFRNEPFQTTTTCQTS